MQFKSSFSNYCYGLIILMVLINGSGLLAPVLNSNDAYFYAIISKNMLTNNNWVDLLYNNQDWLDKPHLPFWLTAVSFKVLGINTFSYILPGFLFHLLGAFYTYRLARLLYNHETGLIAALIYVSSLHLLLSALDVRAEAYLLGEIMPACYYWLIYERKFKLRPLLLASLFSAMALMTKGLFVVVVIFGGIVVSCCYRQHYLQMLRPKWLLAYALTLVLLLPELICLYLQFDAHPEKIVFGQQHISGIAWYFWGSQFGRFFNNGPIVNTHGNPFFFVHSYLWAFLPWSLLFIAATAAALIEFKAASAAARAKTVYLLSSFWLTFILFSATKFQLDHYTNIIMPFAAILCANYLLTRTNLGLLAKFHNGLSILLLVITMCLCSYLFSLSLAGMLEIVPLLLIVVIFKKPKFAPLEQILLYPSLAIGCVFLLLMVVNTQIYPGYAVGYLVATATWQQPLPLYSYRVAGVINSLDFHSRGAVREISDLAQLPQASARGTTRGYYLLVPQSALATLPLGHFIQVATYRGLAQEKFIPALFSPKKMTPSLQGVVLLRSR